MVKWQETERESRIENDYVIPWLIKEIKNSGHEDEIIIIVNSYSDKTPHLYCTGAEMEMSSFWLNFNHWLHWKLSFW